MSQEHSNFSSSHLFFDSVSKIPLNNLWEQFEKLQASRAFRFPDHRLQRVVMEELKHVPFLFFVSIPFSSQRVW